MEENNINKLLEVDDSQSQKNIKKNKSIDIGDAVSKSAFAGGLVGYFASNHGDGTITFSLFMAAYVLLLFWLKGWGKLVGFVVFSIVAAIVIELFGMLETL